MKQDMIVILDLGSHENTVVARAIRALGVYSEIYPHDITAAELKDNGYLSSVLKLPILCFGPCKSIIIATGVFNSLDISRIKSIFLP